MKRLALELGIALLVIGILCSSQVCAQQPSKKKRPKVEPWMKSQILDKGAIAEATYQRLHGLREDGNPHIPGYSVFSGAEFDPGRDNPALQEGFRQRQLQLFGSREIDWSAGGPPVAVNRADKPRAREVADKSAALTWKHFLVVFLIGGGMVYFLVSQLHRAAIACRENTSRRNTPKKNT